MGSLEHITRTAASSLEKEIQQGQSVLLLGPRQVGKTTLIQKVSQGWPNQVMINLLRARDRDRYSVDPDLLLDEISARLRAPHDKPLVVVIDEVQRVPPLLDAVQLLLDEHKGRVVCLLSGSSARRMRRGQVNLLPGRITQRLLFPLSSLECKAAGWSVGNACRFGRLPGIVTTTSNDLRRRTLTTYVATYLQEEIREEGLVRNYGAFRSFLQLAAEHSGGEIRYEKLSRQNNVTSNTIKNYYGILLDTLTAFEVPPLNLQLSLPGKSPRRESKTSKIYLFDPGIINAILERWKPTSIEKGRLVEHVVLGDLLAWLEHSPDFGRKLGHWRQHQGHEVDFVISAEDGLTGIEVKLTRQPGKGDLRGLAELHQVHGLRRAIIACDVDRPMDLGRAWQAIKPATLPPPLVVATPYSDLVSHLT